MNVIDIFILVFFALIMLRGWYDGFLRSVLGVASFFLSWMVSALLSPFASGAIRSQTGFVNAMLYYAEGSEALSDMSLARVEIYSLTREQVSNAVASSALPAPIGKVVEQNIAREALASQNISMIGEYFNNTIVNFAINLAGFLITFIIVSTLLTLAIYWYDYAFKLPVLRHFDSAIGAGFGLIHAFFIMFVIFMVLPMIILVLGGSLPIDAMVDSSFFGSFFYKSNFLLSMIGGT